VFDLRLKSLAAPDRTMELPLLRVDIVEIGDFRVAHVVHQPGWRWSEHVHSRLEQIGR
jgi:hypothetical protein